MKKRILSFSLYGNNEKYTVGAIKNSLLVDKIYPGWIMRVYHDDTVPDEILTSLAKNNVELIRMPDKTIPGMYWRFLTADDPDVERYCVRDADSRLSMREKYAVDEWIESGKILHIMRDHPFHGVPIVGCGFGIYNIEEFNMTEEVINWLYPSGIENGRKEFVYGDDQLFMIKFYNFYKNNAISHDEFFPFRNTKPFPVKRIGLEFVGKIYDKYDNTNTSDEQTLYNHLKSMGLCE